MTGKAKGFDENAIGDLVGGEGVREGEVGEEVGNVGGEGFGVVAGGEEGVQREDSARGAEERKIVKGANSVVKHTRRGIGGDYGGEVRLA